MHTTTSVWSISDDHLQEHVYHREDSNTWSRRGRELSDHEIFIACSTGADPSDVRGL